MDSREAHSFELTKGELVGVRDFDDTCFILIEVGCFLFFSISQVPLATTLERCVACRTFQRFKIEIELNSFIVGRHCLK